MRELAKALDAFGMAQESVQHRLALENVFADLDQATAHAAIDADYAKEVYRSMRWLERRMTNRLTILDKLEQLSLCPVYLLAIRNCRKSTLGSLITLQQCIMAWQDCREMCHERDAGSRS